MGLIVRTFECEACRRRFDITQDRDEPPPDGCPFCPEDEQGTITGPIPSTTAIGPRNMSKATDASYRALEEGSQVRAEALGDPSLKITNIKDNLRAGDVAAITPNNAVNQFAEQQKHNYWGGGAGASGGSFDLGLSTQALVSQARAQRGGEQSPGAVALAAIQGKKAPGSPNIHPSVRAGAGFAGGPRRR